MPCLLGLPHRIAAHGRDPRQNSFFGQCAPSRALFLRIRSKTSRRMRPAQPIADGIAPAMGSSRRRQARPRMTYQTSEACREFDRWSGRYDRDVLQLLFFRPSHRMLLASITNSDERVLDIGCGTGIFATAA